jgi:hypothetical protein
MTCIPQQPYTMYVNVNKNTVIVIILRIESRMISVHTTYFSSFYTLHSCSLPTFLLLDLAINLYEGTFVLKAKGTCM